MDNGRRIVMLDGSDLPQPLDSSSPADAVRKMMPKNEKNPSSMGIKLLGEASSRPRRFVMAGEARTQPLVNPRPQNQAFVELPARPQSSNNQPNKTYSNTRPAKENLNNTPAQDIVMADPVREGNQSKNPARAPRAEWTNELRAQHKPDVVLDKVLDFPVTLPLRELIATSADLSKKINALTKAYKEGNEKATGPTYHRPHVSFASRHDAAPGYSSDDEEELPPPVLTIPIEPANDTVVKMNTLKVSEGPYSISSGLLPLTVHGESTRALVDTGSDVNLISRQLAEKLNLPVDPAGTHWVVQGISGEQRLGGCCHKVQLEIGGLKYHAPFFVGPDKIADTYGLVIGTPWLFKHKGRLEYGEKDGRPIINFQAFAGKGGQSIIQDLEMASEHTSYRLLERPLDDYSDYVNVRSARIKPLSHKYNQVRPGLYLRADSIESTYARYGAKPPKSVADGLSPTIPTIGRNFSEAL